MVNNLGTPINAYLMSSRKQIRQQGLLSETMLLELVNSIQIQVLCVFFPSEMDVLYQYLTIVEYRGPVEYYLAAENYVLKEKPVPEQLCTSLISHGVS